MVRSHQPSGYFQKSNEEPDRVRLTISNWIAIVALCVSIIGSIGGQVVYMAVRFAKIESQMQGQADTMGRHDREIDHLEGRVFRGEGQL